MELPRAVSPGDETAPVVLDRRSGDGIVRGDTGGSRSSEQASSGKALGSSAVTAQAGSDPGAGNCCGKTRRREPGAARRRAGAVG